MAEKPQVAIYNRTCGLSIPTFHADADTAVV